MEPLGFHVGTRLFSWIGGPLRVAEAWLADDGRLAGRGKGFVRMVLSFPVMGSRSVV